MKQHGLSVPKRYEPVLNGMTPSLPNGMNFLFRAVWPCFERYEPSIPNHRLFRKLWIFCFVHYDLYVPNYMNLLFELISCLIRHRVVYPPCSLRHCPTAVCFFMTSSHVAICFVLWSTSPTASLMRDTGSLTGSIIQWRILSFTVVKSPFFHCCKDSFLSLLWRILSFTVMKNPLFHCC